MLTIGSIMQTLRERRGKNLVELARETRISLRILQDLEADQLEALPATVYVKGFIQAYCRCLDFDPSEALRVFEQQRSRSGYGTMFEDDDVSPLSYPSTGNPVESRGGLSLMHAIVLVVAALTFLVVLFGTNDNSDSHPVAEQSSSDTGEGDALTVSPEHP